MVGTSSKLSNEAMSPLSKHSAAYALKNKELVEIFSDWKIEPVSVYAVYASREWMPEKLRVFLKYLKELDINLLK